MGSNGNLHLIYTGGRHEHAEIKPVPTTLDNHEKDFKLNQALLGCAADGEHGFFALRHLA